ncbi:hypothetical protein L2725_08705 [Shewanella corallii]|uniref:Uncharacterized protein n=1 Tax=Shewanella corallii TaxID=560080 RepID=A0ABT0N610_9GAMM|nr:hypothetical protein [Shewanella corallii]MCL2913872.1 hypothetical protein [Shewanella corallii]
MIWFGLISLVPLSAMIFMLLTSGPAKEWVYAWASPPLALFALWALGIRDRFVFVGHEVLHQQTWWRLSPKLISRWPASNCSLTISPVTQVEGKYWLSLNTTEGSQTEVFKECLGPLQASRDLALSLAAGNGLAVYDQFSQYPEKVPLKAKVPQFEAQEILQAAIPESIKPLSTGQFQPDFQISGTRVRLIWPLPVFLALAMFLAWYGGAI